MRVFVAIGIPETIKAGIATVRSRLKETGVDAAWSRPEGLHLTLKFLGEVSAEAVPEILQALAVASSNTGRFRLGGDGVGTFPNPASARVVWIGITGDVGKLVALQATVEKAMVGLEMARDYRPYTPHLTLGRIRHIRKRDPWLKGLEGVKDFKIPRFDVTAISLISSEFGPRGAVYRELGRVALKQEPG